MAGDVHHARGIWEKYHPCTPQQDVPPSTPKQVNPSRAVATCLRRQHEKSMKILILLLCLAFWAGKGLKMEPPSTPQRSVLGSRRAPTPSSSTKKGRATRSKRRSSGQAARAVVDNQPPESSSDTTKGERLGYPRGYEETREGDAHSKLPVYVFLDQFEQDVGTLTLVINDFQSLMTRWWSSDGPRDQSFTGSRTAIGKCLTALSDNAELASYYGLAKGRNVESNKTTWTLSRASLSKERADALRSFALPVGWSEEYCVDGYWKFKTTENGTPVSVTVEKPTPAGHVVVDKITFHHRDVTNSFVGLRKILSTAGELRQDILEHRFAHIRAGMGTHKAPTSVQAIEAGRHGDTIRLSHGGRRRNASRSAGKPFEVQGRVQSTRLALPVNAPERE